MAPKLRRNRRMKIVATEKKFQNAVAVDPWTVVHFAAGLALGLMDAPYRPSMAAAIAYEAAEQVLERREWGQALFRTSGPEALINAFVDVAVFAAGHRLGRRWNGTDGG